MITNIINNLRQWHSIFPVIDISKTLNENTYDKYVESAKKSPRTILISTKPNDELFDLLGYPDEDCIIIHKDKFIMLNEGRLKTHMEADIRKFLWGDSLCRACNEMSINGYKCASCDANTCSICVSKIKEGKCWECKKEFGATPGNGEERTGVQTQWNKMVRLGTME